MSQPIALLLGDRYGVGPELVAKRLTQPDALPACGVIVIGDKQVLQQGATSAGIDLSIIETNGFNLTPQQPWALFNQPFDAPVTPLGHMDVEAGKEVLSHLALTSTAALQGMIAGIVYAPLNKQAMRLAGHAAGDELDFFIQHLQPVEQAGEINILEDLWTSRVTSHIPLRDVGLHITRESVAKGINLITNALKESGKTSPRIAVAALNPHAGEGGAYGMEEIEILEPAIAEARATGLQIEGPFPSDTVFPRALNGAFDGIVTMFHDQGQIALKLIGLGKGITLLAGLPVPVATPGHGTAFDIAGTGKARDDGLKAAIDLVAKMASSTALGS